MTDFAPPSNDPADDDSLAGTMRAAFRKFLQQTDDMLPAVVVQFDRTKNRATVAPCLTVLTTDGRQVARAQVASVPVMQFGGGGMVLNFNLKPGDLGWIKASDRDLSLFLQSYKTNPPNTLRMHTFQDGVFIPEVMRGWTIAAEDAQHAVLQTLDGTARVSVGPDFVKLTYNTDNTVKLSASGVEIFAANNIRMVAPNISLECGSRTITMNSSTVQLAGTVVIDGYTFVAHTHSDPQGGRTGTVA